MLQKLLRADHRIVAFADNDPTKWDADRECPVVSCQEAVAMRPDHVWVAVMKREATTPICGQLRDLGYQGRVHTINDLRDHYDCRAAQLRLLADEINARGIEGAVAELGVFQGEFAALINACFPDRPLHLFDTFDGFDERDVAEDAHRAYSQARTGDYSQTSIARVLSVLPHPEKAVVHQGFFPESIPKNDLRFAFVSIDVDLFAPTYAGLSYFHPRLSRGGSILIHDYNSTQYRGVKEGVRRYCDEHSLFLTPICDLHGSAVLLKC
jgi:O-methyltransferase